MSCINPTFHRAHLACWLSHRLTRHHLGWWKGPLRSLLRSREFGEGTPSLASLKKMEWTCQFPDLKWRGKNIFDHRHTWGSACVSKLVFCLINSNPGTGMSLLKSGKVRLLKYLSRFHLQAPKWARMFFTADLGRYWTDQDSRLCTYVSLRLFNKLIREAPICYIHWKFHHPFNL